MRRSPAIIRRSNAPDFAVNTLCLFLHKLSALCDLLSGKQIICIPTVGSQSIKSHIVSDMFRKLYRGGFLAMYNKHFLRRLLKVCNPCSQMIPVRMTTDTRKVYNACSTSIPLQLYLFLLRLTGNIPEFQAPQ